ncbi:MAG: L-serine ammonia-lyase [Myxococcota bacterium]
MTSVFDLFTIGIGPSSSHTVGPMKAAFAFVAQLRDRGELEAVARVRVELFGSLGATGIGHGTDTAVLLGLMGESPETVAPDAVAARLEDVEARASIVLGGAHPVSFQRERDLAFTHDTLPGHPNAMRCEAFDASGARLYEKVYFSIGGGAIRDEATIGLRPPIADVPYPFDSGAGLLAHCERHDLPISGVMLANEEALRGPEQVRDGLLEIWATMQACVRRGCEREGVLPGTLGLERRAASLHRKLTSTHDAADPLVKLDWVSLYAMAVNEENAAGGRVVTAPTNGAAGIIPAVLHYYVEHLNGDDDGVVRFLLAAGAIGSLYKARASISGAEMGCQGEVGVACSMAAAGLAEVQGGTAKQVEDAAEIGMEHNLGLTCDPVGGLVQVPCIERNTMGAVKAINAARLALRGDGTGRVSLDAVIETMRQTGLDMHDKYKETARGGLALNVVGC